MKFILAIIASTTTLIGISQSYTPLTSDTAVWKTTRWDMSSPGATGYGTEGHQKEGDTIIDGNTYQLIKEQNLLSGIISTTVGAIREDSLRQVWYRRLAGFPGPELSYIPVDTVDVLLWSFNNHQVGDTIEITNHYGFFISSGKWAIVQNIDSILVDGTYRIRYDVQYFGYPGGLSSDYWIAGIGPSLGFASAHNTWFEWYTQLTCYEDLTTNWLNPLATTCLLFSNGLEEIDPVTINIYPNPTTDILNIDGNLTFNRYQVFSINGSLLKSGFVNQNQIRTKEFTRGTYILELSNDGQIARKLFLKN